MLSRKRHSNNRYLLHYLSYEKLAQEPPNSQILREREKIAKDRNRNRKLSWRRPEGCTDLTRWRRCKWSRTRPGCCDLRNRRRMSWKIPSCVVGISPLLSVAPPLSVFETEILLKMGRERVEGERDKGTRSRRWWAGISPIDKLKAQKVISRESSSGELTLKPSRRLF